MKIQIISIARSGSTYLKNLLHGNLNTNYLILSEPFNYLIMKDADENYVKTTIESCKKNKNVLIKNHINQLYFIKEDSQRQFFLEDKSWYRILLLRKNIFKCCISHVVAHMLDNFNSKEYTETQLNIDKDMFEEYLNYKLNHIELIAEIKQKKLFKKILYYEDFSFNEKNDLKKFNFKFCTDYNEEDYSYFKTPYNLIKILNEQELYNIYQKKMKRYTHPLITNLNGLISLK